MEKYNGNGERLSLFSVVRDVAVDVGGRALVAVDRRLVQAGEALFERRCHLEPVDSDVLEGWRCDIDLIYEAMKNGGFDGVRVIVGDDVCDPDNDSFVSRFFEGGEMNDQRFRLFAIGMFILSNKKAGWDDFGDTVRKTVIGGSYSLDDFLDSSKRINCHELSHLVKQISVDLYGIEGEIKVIEPFHRYYMTRDGEVSDLMVFPFSGGVFFSERDYLLFLDSIDVSKFVKGGSYS